MARPLRIEFSGAVYHVTARGNRRDVIFQDDRDRAAFLGILGDVCARYVWACHAYCLMPNHYHLVVETGQPTLARGMRQLNGVYTQRYNRRHKAVGHLFQGRYKAILVDKEAYLLELSRYVVLNPVRAGLTPEAVRWKWSSHRAMLGRAAVPPWLETQWVLGHFGQTLTRARRAYAAFVRAGGEAPSIWTQLRSQMFLGDEGFVARMQQRAAADADLREVPRIQRRLAPRPLGYYAQRWPDRRQAMARAHLDGGYTLKDIAQHFRVHYSTVSRAVRADSG